MIFIVPNAIVKVLRALAFQMIKMLIIKFLRVKFIVKTLNYKKNQFKKVNICVIQNIVKINPKEIFHQRKPRWFDFYIKLKLSYILSFALFILIYLFEILVKL